MSSNLPLTKENHDLSQLVAGLVWCIGNIMDSLFKLQEATIAKEGHDVQIAACSRLRENLRKDWEGTILMLKEARKFADDIRFLATSTASSAEISQYISDLRDGCKGLYDGFADLLRRKDLPCPYDQYWATAPRSDGIEDSMSRENIYEQGHHAKDTFHISRLNYRYYLGQIVNVWSYHLQWLSSETHSFHVEALKALDEEWSRHQASLMNAIVTITHHCDGVAVNAKELPTPPQPRSSSLAPKEPDNLSQFKQSLPVAGFIIGCVGMHMAGRKPGPFFHPLDPSTTVNWAPSPTVMAPGPSPVV